METAIPLLKLINATIGFGEHPLLDSVNLQIDAHDKIFLIGRNGMGKSSLLKVISGQYKLDSGQIYKEPGIRISELSQDLPVADEISVYDYVAQGLDELGKLLKRYHALLSAENHDAVWFADLENVQREIESKHGWHFEQNIQTALSRLELDANQKMAALSGGWKRRAALAKALVSEPDLLLLDEPTNHLDLAAIEWLEDFLANYNGTFICITHDRSLLKKLSNRILELDRGQLIAWSGDYASFLEYKAHRLEVEATHNKKFDKVLSQEEAWIRQGIKARRTRNEGRVRALEQLRIERKQRRELQATPSFQGNYKSDSGALVIDAKNISFKYEDKYIIKDFTTQILRGDKIALIGANGVGKSTFIKLLLGQLSPQQGNIRLGTNLHIAYFDQTRASIDYELSAIDNVGAGRNYISVNGREKHVISYLGDFLFSAERARIPVRMLSGGERNRLLLAKLFSLPSNLLVLDEPTNDLDMESLELLEEILAEYTGTILLVSHDRTFVDNVVTSTIVFKGAGIIEEFVGGFKDIPKTTKVKDEYPIKVSGIKKAVATNAFNSKMRQELNDLPNKIANAEADLARIHQVMSDLDFYNHSKEEQQKTISKLSVIEDKIQQLYARWEELENIRNNHN